jgi:hypoxanthine phosphoribosyltransferase
VTGAPPLHEHPELGRVLVSQADLARRVGELGEQITKDYAGRPPLLVGVLTGAVVFLADLARAIRLPVELDLMAVSSYGASTTSTGVVRIVKDLDHDLAGRDVLLVEDIVDSGLTLDYVRENLHARGPASVEVCALLVRESCPAERLATLRYVGFHLPDDWVVGYGLDVGSRWRQLPDVRAWHAPTPP